MITVTEAAPSLNLTKLDNVKPVLGISGQDNDLMLQAMINDASAAIRRITNRVFAREVLTERIEGSGRVELVLTRVPIISISEVRHDNATITLSDVVISSREAGLIFYQSGWSREDIKTQFLNPWPTGKASLDWEVDYVGGYWLPSFTGNPDASDILLPSDVERACIDIVRSWYVGRTRDPSVTSERIGDWSASYGSAQNVPDNVRQYLENNWRRILL